jgi:hypothetical protein
VTTPKGEEINRKEHKEREGNQAGAITRTSKNQRFRYFEWVKQRSGRFQKGKSPGGRIQPSLVPPSFVIFLYSSRTPAAASPREVGGA